MYQYRCLPTVQLVLCEGRYLRLEIMGSMNLRKDYYIYDVDFNVYMDEHVGAQAVL